MVEQILALSMVNLKSIPQRWPAASVIVVGLAGVVAVFTALLAMLVGFEHTLRTTGRADNALVLRSGSQSELNSALDRDAVALIKRGPGVRLDLEGQPLASAELLVIIELPRRGDAGGAGANVTMRGVEGAALELRPQVRLLAGRMFTPGLREVILGQGVLRQFAGTELGSTLRFRGSDWTVVGIFASGDVHESEIWADLETTQASFGRNNFFQSVLVGLQGPAALDGFRAALAADVRLNVSVDSELGYYSGQTRQFRATIGTLLAFVTGVMALGAIFAALNTMYAAVSGRAREIATLRAIGFPALPVVASVMVEAMVLSLFGGLLGAGVALLLFNGVSLSTLGQGFTQVVFAFRVTPDIILSGLAIALAIGFVGGLLPALRAARIPVTQALRAA